MDFTNAVEKLYAKSMYSTSYSFKQGLPLFKPKGDDLSDIVEYIYTPLDGIINQLTRVIAAAIAIYAIFGWLIDFKMGTSLPRASYNPDTTFMCYVYAHRVMPVILGFWVLARLDVTNFMGERYDNDISSIPATTVMSLCSGLLLAGIPITIYVMLHTYAPYMREYLFSAQSVLYHIIIVAIITVLLGVFFGKVQIESLFATKRVKIGLMVLVISFCSIKFLLVFFSWFNAL